jgi:hypothetical protein
MFDPVSRDLDEYLDEANREMAIAQAAWDTYKSWPMVQKARSVPKVREDLDATFWGMSLDAMEQSMCWNWDEKIQMWVEEVTDV